MPIYDYRCPNCGQQREMLQSMSAQPPECSTCSGEMERWISTAPAVHGLAVQGRELAARSIPQCGKGCSCCP